ncbi:hypothetical protein EYF80_038376 [Liparis tanakae]|uniref:Uncharacterized protein n=1 Tax=Liparis tanakae TaxID=230148 RepID=A0A4Z2GET4_9TELE|nr:hypothetical protein EYF80_038376 [Liparis tanakae]
MLLQLSGSCVPFFFLLLFLTALAGPAQPVRLHDDHRLTLQHNLLGAVRLTHISPLTSLALPPFGSLDASPSSVTHTLLQGATSVGEEFGASAKVLGAVI